MSSAAVQIATRHWRKRGYKVFPDPVVVVGTPTFGTNTVSAPMPATANAGDTILACCHSRLQGAAIDGPAGFKRLKHTNFNNDGNGADLGATTNTTFSKVAVGGENSNLTFNLPGANANSMSVTIFIVRKGDPLANWDIEVIAGGHRIWDDTVGGGTDITCRSWNKVDARKGDHILLYNSSNSDLPAFDLQALTGNAGLGITPVNIELLEVLNTTGNDVRVYASLFGTETSGKKKDYMTHTSRASSSTVRSPVVTCHFIRIRQSTKVQGYIPGGYDELYPDDVTTSARDNDGGGWNYMKFDEEGTIERSVGTLDGWPVFTVRHRYDLWATINARRGETHKTPWQPTWIPGVKLFEGFTLNYRNQPAPPAGQQWIPFQLHTGSAGSSPNHPAMYLEWATQGQQARVGAGLSGSPSATTMNAGELIVAIGMSTAGGGSTTSTRFYIGFPNISCVGNQDHNFEMMIKFGTAGNGRVVIVHNGVIIVDRSDFATIATVPEELGSGVVGTGSVAGCGGVAKVGGYFHQSNTTGVGSHAQAWYNALIAAGGDGTHRSNHRGLKSAVKLPTDADYGDSFDAATLAYVKVAA